MTNDKKHKFLTTHPWIRFTIDLQNAPARLWINLGEARSKCDHLSGVPLRPRTAALLHSVYLAKGVLATTAIEGNTLTEAEVRLHLEGKLKLPESKEYLQQEIDNIVVACNEIGEGIEKGTPLPLSLKTILKFNAQVLEKLTLEPHVVPGQIRDCSVGVGQYLGPAPEDCEYLINRLFDWLSSEAFQSEKDAIVYAIIKAAIAHLYIAWIHPFGDGNGRTARLVEFLILLSAGVPSPAVHLLSNHYNQTRQEYYRQLDQASKSGGDIIPFITYAVQGFVDGLREQLSMVRIQQWDVVWRNYIHEMFQDDMSASAKRQRRLALDLGAIGKPVTMAKLTEITPKTAKAYASKTVRTLQRDVIELEKMGLVKREDNGIRAKIEVIFAFLPLVAQKPQNQPDLPLAPTS